jgi:hypothetical protein
MKLLFKATMFLFLFLALIIDLFAFSPKALAYDCMCPDGKTVAKVVTTSSDCGSVSSLSACSGGSSGGSTVSLDNPIPEIGTDPNVIIGKVINGVMGLVGSIALVMFIYGGFTWMLAAGSPQRVTKGKDILVWATIGLIVIFSAYGLVNFIFTKILSAT